jgi:hypothetical protein
LAYGDKVQRKNARVSIPAIPGSFGAE